MKTIARVVTALALLGFAVPALPCPSMKTTQAGAQPAQPSKEKVAKAEKGSKAKAQRGAVEQKTGPTAAN